MFSSPHKSPFVQFAQWFKAAKASGKIFDCTAMHLATIGVNGFPDARVVLLKEFDSKSFVFYTNLGSVKGKELAKTPKAALTFFWDRLERQVRIQGKVVRVSGAESDAYWKTRPRLSQVGALASQQSRPLKSRDFLIKEVQRISRKFSSSPIPRPPWWAGLRVIPVHFEFWQGQPNRLHDRFIYARRGASWRIQRLYP